MAGRWGARRLVLLTGCLILGMLGPGAVGAYAATPSSLAGETFTSQHVTGSTLTGGCDLEGGSFGFSVSGSAAGPFPGTFTESGRFTALEDGFLTSFSSTFTITNSSGTVTAAGTKTLVGNSSQMTCDNNFINTIENFTAGYTATINGAGGDRGAATVNISGVVGSRHAAPLFRETFGSTGVGQTQCRRGGWKSFGTMFKNQGDCVSFFATGGKNRPAGSSPRTTRPAAPAAAHGKVNRRRSA
jgi:hypothetical protein